MILHDGVPNLRLTLPHERDNLFKLIFIVMLIQFAIQHNLLPRWAPGPSHAAELLLNRLHNMRHAGDGFACPCPQRADTTLKDCDTTHAIELWLDERGVVYLPPMLTELLRQHHLDTALDELGIDCARLCIRQDTHIAGLELLLPLRLRLRTRLRHGCRGICAPQVLALAYHIGGCLQGARDLPIDFRNCRTTHTDSPLLDTAILIATVECIELFAPHGLLLWVAHGSLCIAHSV